MLALRLPAWNLIEFVRIRLILLRFAFFGFRFFTFRQILLDLFGFASQNFFEIKKENVGLLLAYFFSVAFGWLC